MRVVAMTPHDPSHNTSETNFMAIKLKIVVFLLLTSGCLATVTQVAGAQDQSKSQHASVEFRDLPNMPNELTIEVEFIGTDHKYRSKNRGNNGGSGGLFAFGFARMMEIDDNCTTKFKDNVLTIEGWTDPKTKKFHPVKKVTFTSPDIPKEYMPKVTNPPSAEKKG